MDKQADVKNKNKPASELWKNRFFFVIFFCIWMIIVVWNLLTPSKVFSEMENRQLAAWPKFTVPTLLDGEYMDNVNTYLNDQFAGKDIWIPSQSLIEYGLGKRENNNVFLGKNALIGDIEPKDETIVQDNIQGINAFVQQYPNMQAYVALVPGAGTIQPQKLPPFATEWDEGAMIEEVNEQLESGIASVNLSDTLLEHNQEYIFYRTDHHWTTYGAFLAYQQIADMMGLPVYQQSDFEITPLSTDFLGTYHSKTGFPLVKKDEMELYQMGTAVKYEVFDGAQTVEYDSPFFAEFLEKKDKYSYFLGQVQPATKIYTQAQTGKKLIIFKDSYAHCLTPMLMDQYSEILLVDLRYFNMPDPVAYLEAQEYDDALFLYSVDTFSHQKLTSKLA